nr:unnamed protein product [Callosobruchus chinensis]
MQNYSHAIGMEFRSEKYAMVHLKKALCGDSEEEEQLVDGSILRQAEPCGEQGMPHLMEILVPFAQACTGKQARHSPPRPTTEGDVIIVVPAPAEVNIVSKEETVDGFSSSFHNINAGVPQGSILTPTFFTNPIHSFADDSTLHAGIMSNSPISVVELERRRLATAASLSKDLEAIAAWGLKNMIEFNTSKTQYCTLSNKRCPSEHSVLMNNQALPIIHSFKLLGVSITENMIWHKHVSSIATAAGKQLGYLFRARKCFSPSNLLTLYKAQKRPSLEYCSHIW